MLWNILCKKQWKRIVSVLKKILETKILVSKEVSKIHECLYQFVLFVARKNRGLLKRKKLIEIY